MSRASGKLLIDINGITRAFHTIYMNARAHPWLLTVKLDPYAFQLDPYG